MTHDAGMRRLTAMREAIRLAHILFEHMDSPVPVTVYQEPNRNRLSQIGALITYGWIRHDHYRHVRIITPRGREVISEILGMWADALSPLQQHELEPNIGKSINELPERSEGALARAFRNDDEIQREVRWPKKKQNIDEEDKEHELIKETRARNISQMRAGIWLNKNTA